MGCVGSKAMPSMNKFGAKKAAAAEAVKSFDGSKEELNKEFEEKKAELQPKVLELYEASSSEIKVVVKERTEEALKKSSTEVTKFLEDLVKIEFPGSKKASEASTKFSPALVSGPIFFVFEKIATCIPAELTTEPASESDNKEKEMTIEGEAKKEAEKKELEEITTNATAIDVAGVAEEEKEAPKP